MSQDAGVPGAVRGYLSDLQALDRHIAEALKRQSEDERVKASAPAAELIQTGLNTFGRFADDLHQQTERVGAQLGRALKESITGILGVGAGLYDKVRKDPVSRMLRDDYVAFNLAAISYTMLHTTAQSFHDAELATMTKAHLDELTPLIIKINQIMPGVVIAELQDESGADATVTEKAVSETQESWKP